MKVTVQNKKGLSKDLKVLVDKKTLEKYLNEKYEEVSKTVQLKGFRPGKVPMTIVKSRFGTQVSGEVVEKQVSDMQGRLNAISKKLENKNFVDRAPSEIITHERNKFEDYKQQLDKLKENLNSLIK